MIAGLPCRFAVRCVSATPVCTRLAFASLPVHRLRRQIAPSTLKSLWPVDGDSEIGSRIAPPGLRLLMIWMPDIGGTPLPVPNTEASAAAASGAGLPAASTPAYE